jgi:hypothetical protein
MLKLRAAAALIVTLAQPRIESARVAAPPALSTTAAAAMISGAHFAFRNARGGVNFCGWCKKFTSRSRKVFARANFAALATDGADRRCIHIWFLPTAGTAQTRTGQPLLKPKKP